jgi:hypothetical protein
MGLLLLRSISFFMIYEDEYFHVDIDSFGKHS